MLEQIRSKQLDAFHTKKYRLTLGLYHNGLGKTYEVGVRSLANSDDFTLIYLPMWSPDKWFELVKVLMNKWEDAVRTQKLIYFFEERTKLFHKWYDKNFPGGE